MNVDSLRAKNSEDWSFDVFALNSVASGQCLRYMSHYLLNRFGLIQKFKMSTAALESFLVQIESGYERYRNPYHNNMHAADVTQTVAYLLCQAGLAIETALLYNDRAVLENYHIQSVFPFCAERTEENSILSNLSKEEY
ncbi:hypothetical protein TNCV_114451, partial [Trichonephila clavipes]